MPRPLPAIRILAVALAVGFAAELLLHRHALGINVLLATALLLGAAAVVAGGVRRIDVFDAWIPPTALLLAAFVAIRDDAPLLLLDVTAALGLSGAAAAAFAGLPVTRRSATGATLLATRVVAGLAVGTVALGQRLGVEGSFRPWMAGGSNRYVPVIRGLALVVPLLLVFAVLFGSADPIFDRLLGTILRPDVDLRDAVSRLLFVAGVTWLAAGLLWFVSAAVPSVEARSLGAAAASPTAGWPRLGAIEAVTILVALNLLFGLFVVLQLAYLFGGFDTVAAGGVTYAQYARRGFFELVAVVFLVGGLLLALETFVAVRTRGYVAAALGLIALTAVVLASSLLRLRLYQEAYGWTELRFYVLAAIVFLGIGLVAAAVLVARDQARWLPHAVAGSSLVVLVAVNVVGPQAYITARNLERALVPSVVPQYGEATLDAPYLGTLGADAIPALAEAVPQLEASQRTEALEALRATHERLAEDDRSWQAWNLARERARTALEALFGR